jgi:hypothetical protein
MGEILVLSGRSGAESPRFLGFFRNRIFRKDNSRGLYLYPFYRAIGPVSIGHIAYK